MAAFAKAKREQIECELNKCPDLQLYLVVKSQRDRARMKRLLMRIPNFRLWHVLTNSIERAQCRSAVSLTSSHNTAVAYHRGAGGMAQGLRDLPD
jgi:hypothetical protein